MESINLTEHFETQDMIKIVMAEKGLSPKEAVEFSVNKTIHQHILKAGYASIALPLWGHDDPERVWQTLENPTIEAEFDEASKNLISDIIEKEDVDFETAISYFLLFTVETLGYHI